MADPLQTLMELVRDLPADPPGTEAVLPYGKTILHMDNLQAMQRIAPTSIDFVSIDPPFASHATYRQQIALPGHTITRTAYTDVWEDGLAGYLRFLVPRLAAIRPLLKPTGSICVHLDSHSSHYVKIALDHIFGADRLINEVIWRYGKMSNSRRRFAQNHDTLLIYAASDDWYFQPVPNEPSEYRTRFVRDLTGNQVLYGTVKHRSDKLIRRRIAAREQALGRDLQDDDVLFDFDQERKLQDDVFTDISIIRGNAHEGVGFDTQKPLKLLERLITAFCPPDGVVADLFCGSGTTAVAAERLGRTWVVADRGLPAIQTARLRLQHTQHTFARDPALQPDAFVVDGTGAIVDFRVAELGLVAKDEAAVISTVERAPQALIAGQIGDTMIDVFGREATVPR